MKTILTFSTVLLTFIGIASAHQPATTSPSSIQAKLDAIILPSVVFQEATRWSISV